MSDKDELGTLVSLHCYENVTFFTIRKIRKTFLPTGWEKPEKTNGVTETYERELKVRKGPVVWSQSSCLGRCLRTDLEIPVNLSLNAKFWGGD